jgi:L-lactate dehydrogenase complex protein LldE
MTAALFVPCYIDQFYPQVAIATLEVLEKAGVSVVYPPKQTCCGQPMANSGFEHLTGSCNALFVKNEEQAAYIREHVYELTEFLTDIVQVEKWDARFPHKIGVHQSCHGQRGLKLSQMSELVAAPFSKPEKLLKMVEGLEIVELARVDECCGFGGTFCVAEEAVSVKMGKDRVNDHLAHGAEYIVGGDVSCLMHMEGILRRQHSKLKVMHIAEVLNSR